MRKRIVLLSALAALALAAAGCGGGGSGQAGEPSGSEAAQGGASGGGANENGASEGAAAGEPLKVAFVYVGPVGDAGWTYRHDVGRQDLEEALGDRVETTFV